MQDFAKRFYKSKAWERCRAGYLRSVGGLCERCWIEGRITPAKIVHHKIYLTPENILDPSISLAWENLEALCQDCHNKEHFRDDGRCYHLDASGHVILDPQEAPLVAKK